MTTAPSAVDSGTLAVGGDLLVHRLAAAARRLSSTQIAALTNAGFAE